MGQAPLLIRVIERRGVKTEIVAREKIVAMTGSAAAIDVVEVVRMGSAGDETVEVGVCLKGMARNSRPTAAKREREKGLIERRQQKAERRRLRQTVSIPTSPASSSDHSRSPNGSLTTRPSAPSR
jgi:hypothetical protein